MARNKTRSYPESFRKEAVRLADLPDKTAIGVADDLGINVGQIYNWLHISFNEVSQFAKKHGFAIELVNMQENGQYIATLQIKKLTSHYI